MTVWSNLPNLLTIGRILLVPFTIWALLQNLFGLAFAAFLLAGVTDGLDGYLARRFRIQSELGAYLDPLADKLLLVSVFSTLALQNHVPLWLAILAVSRDILIVGALLLSRYLEKPLSMRPSRVSKLNTLVQILFIGFALASLASGYDNAKAMVVVSGIVAVLTVWSFADYMRFWLAHMGSSATGHSQ